jgi:hypothetical protein
MHRLRFSDIVFARKRVPKEMKKTMITQVSTTSKGSPTTRHMSNMTSMEDFEKKFSITVSTNALQHYGVGRTKFMIKAQQEDGRHNRWTR